MSDEYLVELAPGGQTFGCGPDETILDAALRQGLDIGYGCRQGRCSTCKYQVEDGEVDLGQASAYSLPDNERDAGWALLCCARPLTDLLIRDHRPPDTRALPVLAPRELAAQVAEVTQLTPELWRLAVTLAEPLEFYAGQFVELGLTRGAQTVWRSYSMASPPAASRRLEFILKRIEGGAFSGGLDTLASGESVVVRGPFGVSYLRAGTRPVLLCAIGSGLAPILAMLADASARRDPRRFTFYYGARRPQDLPDLESLAGELDLDLTYVPTLDGLEPGDDWQGAVGNVTRAIQGGVEDAHDVDAYLCGAPPMCDAVGRLLAAKGLPADQLYFDRFFAASK
ncbi:MAG: 2Fe-2S iron-sulfur cluster binding domain-containing protein [Gammaproteobacteria bacterium]|nr:2Fe-2S iron-sulfur cluster binding domain-containing protein [Gammaproteobacteria bacterium]